MLNAKLIKGSFVLLVAFGLFNLLNFIYQFAMARLLSVAEYGILAALFAIIYIFAIFSDSIQIVIAKYTVNSEDKGQIRSLISKSLRKGRFLATIFFSIYLVLSIPLSVFFDISYMLLAMNGLIIYLIFCLPVSRGVLQGRKQFVALGTNLVVESMFKLIFGILFVIVGWKVYGAIGGFILGALISFLLSFISLKDIYKFSNGISKTKDIYEYARPTTFITAIIVLFYSVDVILAKIMFSPETAGAYAISSILGKIVLWLSVPIGKAMFPLSAENQTSQKNNTIFTTSIIILLLIVVSVLCVFYFFSDFIVTFFAGKPVPEAAEILFYIGISFSIIAFANMILVYRLSLGPIKNYLYLFSCNFVQILLLLFLSENLKLFSFAFIVSSAILLISSIVFVKINRHV